jgi:hypothetical protein
VIVMLELGPARSVYRCSLHLCPGRGIKDGNNHNNSDNAIMSDCCRVHLASSLFRPRILLTVECKCVHLEGRVFWGKAA